MPTPADACATRCSGAVTVAPSAGAETCTVTALAIVASAGSAEISISFLNTCFAPYAEVVQSHKCRRQRCGIQVKLATHLLRFNVNQAFTGETRMQVLRRD